MPTYLVTNLADCLSLARYMKRLYCMGLTKWGRTALAFAAPVQDNYFPRFICRVITAPYAFKFLSEGAEVCG